MAFSINTNLAALSAHRNLSRVDQQRNDTLERLSTGLRINKAADDASGLSIADGFHAQSLGIGQAIQNGTDATSLVQIADGALQESTNIVNTIRTKAVQAASDGQTTETRQLIQNDINHLLTQLDNIGQNTEFNGQKLLSGAFTNKSFQIGANANQTVHVSIASTESSRIGQIRTADLALSSPDGGDVQLTINSSITGQKLTLNTISVESNNQAEHGIGALASELNRYSSTTGIQATAVVQATGTTAIVAGKTGADFAINGVNIGTITVQNNDADSALVHGINAKTNETGITAATTNDGKLILTSNDGRAIQVTGDLGGVSGGTNAQLSTIGHIHLVQSGVSDFQIGGIGAGATGTNVTISADLTTVQDAVLASGSKIAAGSQFATGTVIGGDAVVESTVGSTQLDSVVKGGSTLKAGTILTKGTEITGSLVVAGNTVSGGQSFTTLAQDSVLSAGTTLKAQSVLGKGTVIETDFTVGTTQYKAGDTLTSAVTLSNDLTLAAATTLKANTIASDNSQIVAGSTLASGSVLGADTQLGITYDSSSTAIDPTAGALTTTGDTIATTAVAIADTVNTTVKAGSLLKSGSSLTLAVSTYAAKTPANIYDGPTLVHTTGVLRRGDTISADTTLTLQGDQVLSSDLALDANGTAGSTFAVGSVLATGFAIDAAATSGSLRSATLTNSVLATDLTLKNGSTLQGGSTLLAGSILGANTYVYGGATSGGAAQTLSTYKTTQLKAGSFLESSGVGATTANVSVLAKGSTVGASTTTTGAVTLSADQTLKTGSVLAATGNVTTTLLKSGTLITQDMILNTSYDGAQASEVNVTAGSVLSSDLYIDGKAGAGTANITLSSDLTVKQNSVLATSSTLAINTENAGTVGLSNKHTDRLSDINVLTGDGAQTAISIADAALKDLNNTRATLGSVQNQLSSTVANLSVTQTNVNAAESGIRDVDFANEAGNFSRLQILSQAGSFALSQANAASQSVLSLLQR